MPSATIWPSNDTKRTCKDQLAFVFSEDGFSSRSLRNGDCFILFSPSIINLRYSWKELRWKYLRTLSLVRTHRSAPSHLGSMSSTALIRFAARTQPSCLFRSSQPARRFSPLRESYAGSSATATGSNFSTSVRRAADKDGEGAAPGHGEETFQEFTARYANRLGWPTIRLIHSETFGLRYLQRIG